MNRSGKVIINKSLSFSLRVLWWEICIVGLIVANIFIFSQRPCRSSSVC